MSDLHEAYLNLIGLTMIERAMWPEPPCDPEERMEYRCRKDEGNNSDDTLGE